MKVGKTNKGLVAIVGASVAAALMVIVPQFEGTKFDPYYDSVGIKTVCTGSIEGVEDRTYTPEECGERLDRELASHAEGAMTCLERETTKGERIAYVSLAFNIGVTAFCNSTLVRVHNAGFNACQHLLSWNKGKVGGKLVAIQGLTNRRQQEYKICMEQR
jgi:lysozyme